MNTMRWFGEFIKKGNCPQVYWDGAYQQFLVNCHHSTFCSCFGCGSTVEAAIEGFRRELHPGYHLEPIKPSTDERTKRSKPMSNPSNPPRVLRVTMPDGSKWDVPVSAIAASRAEYYKDEFGGDVHRSLDEDTLPLFAEHAAEIQDWAENNMNWDDVKDVAVKVSMPTAGVDYQEGWINGEKELL